MPAAVLGPLLAATATGTAAVIGSKMSSSANTKASELQAQSNKEATDLARQAEANRKAEFDQQQAQLKAQWEAEQANKEPYRQASRAALMSLSDLFGLPVNAATGGGNAASNAALPSTTQLVGANYDPAKAEALWKTAYTQGQPFNSSYWQNQWAGLVARGQQLGDPNYAEKRLLGYEAGGADVPNAGPFAGAGGVKAPTAQSLGSQISAPAAASVDPLQFQALFRVPYQPRQMGV